MNGATGIVTTKKKKPQPNLFPDSGVKGKKMLVKRNGMWTHGHIHTHIWTLEREKELCLCYKKVSVPVIFSNSSSLLLVQSISHFPICVERNLQCTNTRVHDLSFSSPVKCQPPYTNWVKCPQRRSTKMLASLYLDWELQTETQLRYICIAVAIQIVMRHCSEM